MQAFCLKIIILSAVSLYKMYAIEFLHLNFNNCQVLLVQTCFNKTHTKKKKKLRMKTVYSFYKNDFFFSNLFTHIWDSEINL